ncbi:MAG: tetratricopeptide repeat protein [Elusimicrobia bacterium]|nr:tetratricopeptide repeat protein [Elusimicrobiota bacterium]
MKSAAGQANGRSQEVELFARKIIAWWLPILYFLISSLFYLRTYDSAQVKITVMQMGGLALLVFWVARLIEARGAPLSRSDLVCISPFLAYLAVGVLSFTHSPYAMASVDFFIRHFFFMTVALIVICEFNAAAADRLTRILVMTGWVAVVYGFWQIIDNTWFPPGVGKGIDPFIWRGAFGQRIFSTYGNPNFFADFLVILFPILFTQYLKTRKKRLLPLMTLLLIDLIMTGTKGAWVGFAMVIFLFGAIAFTYFKEQAAPYRKWILGVAAAGILGLVGFVAKDLSARIVSVNFRLFTWEATWELIMTQPWIGTGIGSFPPAYPAFRRPPIFHIEGKHNTETDHSENEYLEQILDNGLLGFGIFIWMMLSTMVVGFRSLGQLTTTLSLKDGRPPPRAYDLTGYLVALMGMLGHNCFDVSLRFVSSGVYLGLLCGMIVFLARGSGLYEMNDRREVKTAPVPGEASLVQTFSEFLVWPARLAAWGGLAWAAFFLFRDFADLQGPVERIVYQGDVLQWWLAWAVLSACVLAMTFLFVKLVYLSEKPAVALAVLAALYPLRIFWGYFKADVHHNVGIFFSKQRQWDQALHHYQIVQENNPNFVMSLYFMGNVFFDRFNMDKQYNPAWGDRDNQPRDDYERALDVFNEVRRLAPNYVQMHHQVGTLHMRRAEWAMGHGHPEEVPKYLERALNRFKLYEAIDPVYAPNYFRMGQIFMVQKRFAEAARVFEAAITAEKCEIDAVLLRNTFLRSTLLAYQGYVQESGRELSVHRHESAEAYTNLANAYFLMDNLQGAERAYRKALSLDSHYEQAKRNLSALYQKAQSLGLLRVAPAPFSLGVGSPVSSGYEIVPSKK